MYLDGSANLWDIESNKFIKTYHDEIDLVITSVKIAPGNIIIKGYDSGLVKIENSIIHAHTDAVADILILSKNKFITCSSDKTLKLFDFETFECTRTFIGHKSEVFAIDKISKKIQ